MCSMYIVIGKNIGYLMPPTYEKTLHLKIMADLGRDPDLSHQLLFNGTGENVSFLVLYLVLVLRMHEVRNLLPVSCFT